MLISENSEAGDMMGIRRKQDFILVTLDNYNELIKKCAWKFNFPVFCLSIKDDWLFLLTFVVSKTILNNNSKSNKPLWNTIWVEATVLVLASRI